jgi:DnaJ-domain-containing protein 1
MAKTRDTAQSSSATPARVSGAWQALTRALFDEYRPERHYMRGRGPKWHEKHDRIVRALQAAYQQGWNECGEAEKMTRH